jgi:hypothetical protein
MVPASLIFTSMNLHIKIIIKAKAWLFKKKSPFGIITAIISIFIVDLFLSLISKYIN